MTNEKILLQLEKGYDIKNPQLAQALSNLEDKIGITKAELEEAIETKANLVGGKVPAEELPSYVDDVIEFNNIQVADAEISSIIGNNLYKNQIRFINNSTTLPDRIGSEDKYPNMFVNFGENTSEDDWTTFEPEEGKIYVNTTNNHSYRWSGSYLIDLDSNWSNGIKDLQENTVRTDSQDLSVAQQKQALENLGMKVYVTDSTFLGSTLSAEEMEEVTISKALLFTDTGDLFLVGVLDSNKVTFVRIKSNHIVDIITVTRSTGGVSLLNSYNFRDNEALHFTAQNPALTSAQQAQAFKNLGWNVFVTDSSFLNSTDLTDEVIEELDNSRAILITDTGQLLLYGNSRNNKRQYLTFKNSETVQILTIDRGARSVGSLFSYQYSDAGAVRFDGTQSLTDAEQAVARTNIGVLSPDELINSTNFISELRTKLGLDVEN